MTPGGWERTTGMRLRFVYPPRGPSLLVADDARINTRGLAVASRGRRRRDGMLTGAATVVTSSWYRRYGCRNGSTWTAMPPPRPQRCAGGP